MAEIFKGRKTFKVVHIHDEFLALGKVTIDVHESQVDVPHKMCVLISLKLIIHGTWVVVGDGRWVPKIKVHMKVVLRCTQWVLSYVYVTVSDTLDSKDRKENTWKQILLTTFGRLVEIKIGTGNTKCIWVRKNIEKHWNIGKHNEHVEQANMWICRFHGTNSGIYGSGGNPNCQSWP